MGMKSFSQFLNERVEPNQLKISRSQYKNFRALEIDTLGPSSPKERQKLVDALENPVKQMRSGLVIEIDREIQDYLVNDSIPNIIDIMMDNGQSSTLRSFQQLLSKVKAMDV